MGANQDHAGFYLAVVIVGTIVLVILVGLACLR